MPVNPSMSVLLVDDYAIMIRILRNLLRQIGIENVDEASDGGEALGMLQKRRYDLIISDWNMQPMSGLELLGAVRADPVHGDVPFIMVTAESKTNNVLAARMAGVSTYIVKPFNAQTLRSRIEAVCTRQSTSATVA
ncbi:MAG TPA: response regulator [Beijerinckiaceae bacterium]|nr:response regulator [Beijerinckiaceae bacterium]